MREIKAALFGYGMLDAGSGGRIKKEIEIFIRGSLVVFSAVAVASMLVACFGVANLIVASIETRRFEFGVLRAVGAQRGLLTRLVLAEAVVIGLTASIAGTLMGIQGAWAGKRIYELLIGLLMELRVPIGPTLAGWGAVFFFTVGAAVPAVVRLNRQRTRELLASTKG
jgi:putative ABC transport system permease protein